MKTNDFIKEIEKYKYNKTLATNSDEYNKSFR